MGFDFNKTKFALREHLLSLSKQDINDMIPKSKFSNCWVDIEDEIPMYLIKDFLIHNSGTEIKVKYENGDIGSSIVYDSNTWYHHAKENKITHWYKDY